MEDSNELVDDSEAELASRGSLLRECGEAPRGLRPSFVRIQSSASPGVVISAAVQGNPRKPPIVLNHGFPDNWCVWAHVIPTLAREHFVVVPDMRGFNRSTRAGDVDDPADVADYDIGFLVADMADVVKFAHDRSGGQKVTLVAHDWGGYIAWAFAHAVPENLAHLVVVGTPHPESLSDFLTNPDPAKLERQALQASMLEYIAMFVSPDAAEVLSANGFEKLRDLLFSKFIQRPEAFPQAVLDASARDWASGSLACGLKYYRANLAGTSPPVVGLTISVPTTLVEPSQDGSFLYPENGETLGNHMAPGVPFEIVSIDSGHFVQREHPHQLATIIEQATDN